MTEDLRHSGVSRPPTSGAEIGTVLAEVRDCGPCTVRDIAVATGLSESTVRRHLADLESSQLVESDNYQRRARVYMDARVENSDA